MMKNLLFFFALCLCCTVGYSQSFTAGNLAIYRYGDGVSAMPTGVVVPVFIDEYTTAGVLVSSKAIPAVSNGSNHALTGLGRLSTGLYQQEGMSTLSQDGKYLTIFGYNQADGSAIPTTSDGLVVGVIAADGSYNSTTTVSNAPSVGLGAPRSAVFDGTGDIWANGYQNGVQYTTLGAQSTSTRVSVQQNSPRTLGIFNNTLYAPIGGSASLASANPLPVSSTTFTTKPISAPTPTTNQVALFSVGTRTIMYTVDDASNTIRRYYLNMAGDTWLVQGTVSGPETAFVKSITGIVSVSGSNTIVDLYATTWGNDGNGTESSKLIKFSDTFVTATASNTPSTSAITTLATAPANTVFRSVTLTPSGSANIGTAVLPVKLSSFKAKREVDGINLSWITQSEINNAYFEIRRSTDGKEFRSIGRVSGKGSLSSTSNYSFLDKSPANGTNYYQLSQVDNDGKTTLSEIVAAQAGLSSADLIVNANESHTGLDVSVTANATEKVTINVFNSSGLKIAGGSFAVEEGPNKLNVPFSAVPGVYVVVLTTSSSVTVKKIIL